MVWTAPPDLTRQAFFTRRQCPDIEETIMAIKLPKDSEAVAITSLIRYFDEELDQELSDIQARSLLQFCLVEIGPSVFNQAVSEAQGAMERAVSEMSGTCFEQEFSYKFKKKP